MSNTLTTAQRDTAANVLAICAALQTELWNNSMELENILGCAVDTTLDLEEQTIDSILERDDVI
jgi:hypothetical protein